MKVKIDDLTKEIMKSLNDYVGVTEEAVERGVTKTAKTAVQELRNANPEGSGEYGSWNDYNKSWTVMQTKTDKRYHRKATIHNKEHYRLTHLLEKGHALVHGGRKIGETRAFVHIKPVADKAEDNLLKNIKKEL